MEVMECPQFEGGEAFAVQQGAGMVVTNTDEKQIYASVQFLKWFTEDERNIRFSVASGYLPVTKSANDVEKIQANASLPEGNMLSIISAAINTVNQNTLYTTKAFENGTSARSILEYSMSDKAAEDRAAVVERLQAGMSLEEAAGEFVSDESFERWYEGTKAELEALMK